MRQVPKLPNSVQPPTVVVEDPLTSVVLLEVAVLAQLPPVPGSNFSPFNA
jgi:hypothetical protein